MKTPQERLTVIFDFANDFPIDPQVPIRRYFRSGSEMLKMGDTYYNEGNNEHAYIMYLKEHPEFKRADNKSKLKAKEPTQKIMARCEKIKALLLREFAQEYETWLKEEEKRQSLKRLQQLEQMRLDEENDKKSKEELAQSYHQEKERSKTEQKDREMALYMQLQMENEHEIEQTQEALRRSQLSTEDVVPMTPDRSSKPLSNDRMGIPDNGSQSTPVIPNRASKPKLSKGLGSLRNLSIPTAVMAKFLSFAQKNTSQGKETGAFLAGIMANNELRITHVICPAQTGKADSFDTEGEEDMWDYLDKHDLLTLGWIHTHPTQTAFLSSVDLHMHFGYQALLNEAIAIVCAPKFNETGFFTLTATGMELISCCRQTGFHPHPTEPPLFEEGSHFALDHNVDVELVDLSK
ncbi:hypothetical protein TCAL_07750 [Tigriopus californicus]|uniref:MPN domain-containing protein n=1 Tax=Tigriopus californicus TaxID=6832 RepID=A0A553PTA0_TIGCA|nr:hypothetical protein TCAL_07750 [Tigriopus californicus]|eukprot:TCALIF_07750-PA protein Name:"Similar to stambpa STAM-binding protein-like A (Danio rerio)" AED:0.06 eAED:0.06 QI:191/0.87/0.77/1/0.75/0.66/9/64/405